MIDADQASTHRGRHFILQALRTGGDDLEAIRVDVVRGRLGTGECLPLCSDGLGGEIPASAIARIPAATVDHAQRAERLTAAANEAGGRDNVTVITVFACPALAASPNGSPKIACNPLAKAQNLGRSPRSERADSRPRFPDSLRAVVQTGSRPR